MAFFLAVGGKNYCTTPTAGNIWTGPEKDIAAAPKPQ